MPAFSPSVPEAASLSCREPHVLRFRFRQEDQHAFTFPFELMGYLLLAVIAVTLVMMWQGESSGWQNGMLLLVFVFLPFYLPGVYYYLRYARRFEKVSLEYDAKDDLIQFTDHQHGQNLLFHREHIQQATLLRSIWLPYQIDALVLTLPGGTRVLLSSLIVEPQAFLELIGVQAQAEARLLTPLSALRSKIKRQL